MACSTHERADLRGTTSSSPLTADCAARAARAARPELGEGVLCVPFAAAGDTRRGAGTQTVTLSGRSFIAGSA
eukprot:6842206-Prymnesium_polylepis.1